MKYLIPIILSLVLSLPRPSAVTYYVDPAGNDNNTGTTTGTPWRTAAKVSSSIAQGALQPGDQVLFKRGGVWHETLVPTKSGNAASPIVYGAYGSGNKPIITGLETLTTWTNLGGNIYESSAFSSLATCNIVTINNAIARRGREPDYNEAGDYTSGIGGYKKITQATFNTLTANSFSNSPINWTNAFATVRVNNYIMQVRKISAHSSAGQLTFTSNFKYIPSVGNGFFITNDPRTLDQHGEWYFDPVTKRLRVYLGTDPINYVIKAADIDRVLNINNVSNIIFNDLQFEGSNSNLVDIQNTSGLTDNLTFEDLNLLFAGTSAMTGQNANLASVDNIVVRNSFIYEGMNFGIDLQGFGNNQTIEYNIVDRVGMHEGFNESSGRSSTGIFLAGGSGYSVANNVLTNMGYNGIRFNTENNVEVRNNFIYNFSRVLSDAGGIYFGYTLDTAHQSSNRVIKKNVVVTGRMITPNGVTANTGRAVGIYGDANANHCLIDSNVVHDIDHFSYLFNNINDIVFTNNIGYGETNQGLALQQAINQSKTVNGVTTQFPNRASRNNTFRNNIFVAKRRFDANNNLAMAINNNANANHVDEFGDMDLNVYARPSTDPNNVVSSSPTNGLIFQWQNKGTGWNFHNLAQWKAATIHDDSSSNSPLHYPGANLDTCSIFIYNTGEDDTTIAITEQYIDMLGTVYNPPNVTLKPFTGKFLLATNIPPPPTNAPPVAIAGNDQQATLPYPNITTITLNPTADSYVRDGTFATTNFGSNDSVAVKSSNFADFNRHSYFKFSLASIDVVTGAKLRLNGRQIDNLTLQPNLSLFSVADDSWTEGGLIWNNKPAPGTSALSVTSITPTQQYYEWEVSNFTVSQFNGDKVVSLCLRNVATQNTITSFRSRESSTNKPQLVVQSVSYLTLNGEESFDTDGVISYAWTKQSGPEGGTLSNANSAVATVTDFIEGVYVYRLTVTDDDGATSFDELSIEVTPSGTPNEAPEANAGVDQTITLPTSQVTVDAESPVGSNDPDGTISSYLWQKISGGSATITSPTAASTTITGLAAGNYIFRLTVTDDDDATDSDELTVTVNTAPTTPAPRKGVKVGTKGQSKNNKIMYFP